MFDVCIVGGGNAGISAAARLIRKGIRNVAVIESNRVHTYRPLLSYVGAGQASLTAAERTQRSVTPKGVTWVQERAVSVDPDLRVVTTESGKGHSYRDLVLCTGLVPDDEALPGIDAALNSVAVSSNYVDLAEKTWQLVQSVPRGGRAVFTVPRAPVSCTGTTLKPLFLAAGQWKRDGTLPSIDITLVIDRPHLLGVPELDRRLRTRLLELGVRIVEPAAVAAVRPDTRTITVTREGGTEEDLGYDFLHLVPPFRGQRWLQSSGLTDDARHGLVDIDATTFRHRTHPDVWAIGDGAAVETDPSGGGLRKQVSILVGNILAAREGRSLDSYDGYTVAPVPIDSHSLIAGEFDRSGAVQSSLPSFLDPLKPRRSAWLFDRYGLPRMYWYSILRGRV